MDRDTRDDLIRELSGKRVGKYMPNRANTPAQKREVIERLFLLWDQNPELRFGQLLANLYPESTRLYYAEDYELTSTLEMFYEHRKTL